MVSSAQRLGEPDDALLVGVRDDQGALAVGEELLEHDDLADLLEVERGDDVERLVEHDLLAALRASSRSTPGLTLTRSLRPPVKMSTVSSSLRREEDAEAGRRLGEPVDLLLERHDLVAGLAEGLGEALVLRRDRRRASAACRRAAARGRGSAPGASRQPAAQVGDLGLEEAHLARELVGGRGRPVLGTPS